MAHTAGITSRSFTKFQAQPATAEDSEESSLGVNRAGQGYTLPQADITVADCGQQAVINTDPVGTAGPQNPLSKPSNRK